MSNSGSLASLTRDFERFKRELPRDFPAHVRDTYRINLAARYLGRSLPHPIGKGSGQLSLNSGQLETDFSPTLAGDQLSDEKAQILRWLREVPQRIRAHADVRLSMKLMNARFDDDFQVEMMAAASSADALVVFNRLFDPELGVAYGGAELSDRNLRVLDRPSGRQTVRPSVSGTGNIHSGRMIVDYALRGCSSVQLHTFFQLPLEEYPATDGSRTQRALHALVFDPRDGLLAVMLEREAAGTLARRGGELRFLDLLPGEDR